MYKNVKHCFHSCHQCDNINGLNECKQQTTNNIQLYSCARSQHAIRVSWLNIITVYTIHYTVSKMLQTAKNSENPAIAGGIIATLKKHVFSHNEYVDKYNTRSSTISIAIF